MQLYRSPTSIHAASGTRVVAIGVFDGLHIGHQKLIQETQSLAAARGARSMVLTFEPMPREHFAPENPPARLTSFRERYDYLCAAGIDELCCLRFSSVQQLSSDAFIDSLLVGQLMANAVVVGDDFKFGAGREGTVDDLREASRLRDFDVRQIPPVAIDGMRVSSTAVREALTNGDFATAASMLGRPYEISGKVVRGLSLGRKLGFPTANIALNRRVAAVMGIFAVRVSDIQSRSFDGVASLGVRPTVGGGKPVLEVHIFDFDEDIYGQRLSVQFVAKLRDEQKFDDLQTMQQQMERDAVAARAALAG